MSKKEIKITRKQLQKVADYKPKSFPKYSASLINLLNRWARSTDAKIVGQMSDLVQECPHKDYDKWREWYLKKHPTAIDDATKLIMAKLKDVENAFKDIDEKIVKIWVEDLVIDKSFWGLKIQEAIIIELEKITNEKCRLANKQEESKGIDGFVGNIPIQIKPSSYKTASNVKNEKLRAKTIYYEKNNDGDFIVDYSELE
jgi:hypothetical protein